MLTKPYFTILVGGPVSYGRDHRYKPTKLKPLGRIITEESPKKTQMLKKGGEVDVFHCLTQMKVTEMAFTGKCKLDKFANVEMCAN